MEKDLKDILLKDLCARLPYKVKAQIPDEYGGYTSAIESIDIDGFVVDFEGVQIEIEYIKPYLFPLSSMTEQQKRELQDCVGCEITVSNHDVDFVDYSDYGMDNWYKIFNWLNKTHFDYRGLIEKGLAIDATGLNIY